MDYTLPSVHRLHQLFCYDRGSGALSSARTKRVYGSTSQKSPYIYAVADGHTYLAHRIIWKMMTGQEPPRVDHRDTNGRNNCWDNLREATVSQNAQNSRKPADNSSGVKGICWEKARGKWRATVGLDRGYKLVGRFSDLSDAAKAVAKARAEMHGEFARAA